MAVPVALARRLGSHVLTETMEGRPRRGLGFVRPPVSESGHDAAFQNPEFYKAQAMRLSTYDKPRVIACAEDHPHHIGLPRGCLDGVHQTLTDLGIRTVVRDQRYNGDRLEVKFQGKLRPE